MEVVAKISALTTEAKNIIGMISQNIGVIVLGHGQIDIEKVINTLREMLDTFKTNNWDPIRCGPWAYVIKFTNENVLKHIRSQGSWSYIGGGYFHVNQWRGEEGL